MEYIGWLTILILVLFFIFATLTNRSHGPINGFYAAVTGILMAVGSIGYFIVFLEYKLDATNSVILNENEIRTDTILIKSAALNSEIHGEFVLGCGSVDNEDVYKFYQIVDSTNTSYKLNSVPTKKTRIQEIEPDPSFVPHIITYYYTEYTRENNFFVRAFLNKPNSETFTNQNILKEHVIYVPKGTIVSDVSKLNI